MARRSLKASQAGIERAKRALRRLGLTQKELTIDPPIASWGTINGFFNGRAIDHTIFKEICVHLELDWRDIYEPPQEDDIPSQAPNPEPAQSTEESQLTQPTEDPLLLAVQQQAIAAREALTPRILERIPREVVGKKYLPAIDRGVNGGQQRIIPIIGAAGYGKSTILGGLYDQLTQSDTPWVGLILCNSLSMATAVRSFISYSMVASTFVGVTGYNPASPSSYQASMIETGFGQSLCGTSRSILEVTEHLNRTYGRGVLLIDTLDLVISRDFIPAFVSILKQLLEQGTTVVFTCRDHEYNDYLEPTRERLPGISQTLDRHTVPNFTTTEIRTAAETFFQKLESATPEQGRTFADNILSLSADNRSLRDIIENPLLLALLCDLFAQEGNVPPDLTVTKLYKRYWSEKIAYSRADQSHFKPLAIEKENLCLTIARALFEMSQTRLCESLYRDEIGVQFTELTSQAFADLFSEGVLESLPSSKIHFFHQTLLEYAIAYWLTRHTAQTQRNQLLDALRQPETAFTRSYWLPILRQLLTLVDEAEFESLIERLNTQNMGVFSAIAFAATSRDRPDALVRLLPTALELGESYQRRLRQALESAPRHLIENIWDMLLILLEQSEHATAGNTAQMIGDLLERWWQPLKHRLPETLSAIARRNCGTAQQAQIQDERALFFGWLLHPCLPLLEQSPDSILFTALQQHIHLFGYRTCARVIELHRSSNIPSVIQQALLKQLTSKAVPRHETVDHALSRFIASLLPEQLATGSFPLGNSWSEIIYRQLPHRWEIVQSKAIGIWSTRDNQILSAILNETLFGEMHYAGRNQIALTEAIAQGAGQQFVQCLLLIKLETLEQTNFKTLAPLLIRSVPSLTSAEQELLAQWLLPHAQQHFLYLYSLLDVLADASVIARQTLERFVKDLPEPKRTEMQHHLLRFQPIHCHPPLAALDKASQRFLLTVYHRQAPTDAVALERLLEAAQCQVRDVALLASQNLEQIAGQHFSLTRLFPLLQSIFPGVRVNALNAMLQSLIEPSSTSEHQHSVLNDVNLTILCQLMAHEENQTAARLFCHLITKWVRQQQRVPAGVLKALQDMPDRLLKQQLFEGGTARALLDALKAIAQSEHKSIDASALSQLGRKLLTSIHIIQIRNSESEMIDLLCAINRVDSAFLNMLIETDCPILAGRGWLQNIFAVIKTIRRIEGQTSIFFDEMLTQAWCTPQIKSAILAVRGN